ncbi:hypothetical protein FKM82_001451 [Ascaphus truei]
MSVPIHCTIIYTPLSQQLPYPSIKSNPTNPLFTPSFYYFLLLGISLLILNPDINTPDLTHATLPSPPMPMVLTF